MALPTASDNKFPKVIVTEGSTPSSPASGNQSLFIDSADHKLKRVNSSGSVTTVEGGSGGSVASDTIWDAKGDLAAGTGADTASKLTVGSNNQILVADSSQTTGLKWVSGGSQILFDSTLGADTASIDTGASGIAGGFNVLEIWVLTRTDDAASAGAVAITFNNDTGANYDQIFERTVNASVSGGNNLAQSNMLLDSHGGGGGANYATVNRMTIVSYAATTFYKIIELSTAMPDSTAANNVVRAQGWAYKSTTAISRMKVAAAGSATNLKAGSRLLIMGR